MSSINPIVRRFIEEAGNATQSFGLGRVAGQLYAYLYFSKEPRNLADMQRDLGISKGSASTVVRQLEQWGGAKKVWIKGDRKDYYRAEEWIGKVLRTAALDIVGKKLQSCRKLVDNIEEEMRGLEDDNGDHRFIAAKMEQIKQLQKKTEAFWNNPFIREMLK